MSNSLFNFGVQSFLVQTGDPYASSLTGIVPVTRVQSSSANIVYPRTDQFDWAGNGEDVMVERPTVSVDCAYLPTNGANEKNIGLYTDGVTPALLGLNSEQNYYIIANLAHADMLGYAGPQVRTFALGNAVLTSYNVGANVGQIPNVSVTLDGLNLLIQTGRSGQSLPSIAKQNAGSVSGLYSIPQFTDAINPNAPNPANTVTALRPGSLVLQFDTGSTLGIALSGADSCVLQSFNIAVALPRISIKSIGWAYPDSRPLQWPITVNVQAQAYVTDYQAAALNQFNCPDSGHNIALLMNQPCSSALAIGYTIKGAKLNSESVSSQIGGLNRVSLGWTAKIYDLTRSGINDANFYVLASGTI